LDKAAEEASKTAFKKIPVPPRLDTFLISHQIRQFCDQLATSTNQSFSRLYATQGVVSNLEPADVAEADV
jgi:protein involved in ribonucleotide reduction